MKTLSRHKNRWLKWLISALALIAVFTIALDWRGQIGETHKAISSTHLYTSPHLGFSVEIPQVVAAYDSGCEVETSHFNPAESVISYRPMDGLVPLTAFESTTTESLLLAPSYYYLVGGETDFTEDGTLSRDNTQPTFGEFSMCTHVATTLDNIQDRGVFIQLFEVRVTSDADLERLANDNFLCDVGQKLPDSEPGVYDVTLRCDRLHADSSDTDYRIKYYPARREAVFFPLSGPRGCQLFLSVAALENPSEYPTCYDGTIIKTLKFD